MYKCETQIPERNHISNSLDFSLEISTVLVVLRLAVKAFILGSLRAYMSKTDHEYDIVDIVTISTNFVDIDTSTLWRYSRYRYDIDTYFDDIVDIETISTMFRQHRYKHSVTISSISLRYRQISSISILSHCRWIKSPILVAICLSTIISGVEIRPADKN